MKLKYTLGALVAAFALAGCSLDVNMYDGVTGEDVTARNIVELSQGSYSMLKYDGGLIDYGYYFWYFHPDFTELHYLFNNSQPASTSFMTAGIPFSTWLIAAAKAHIVPLSATSGTNVVGTSISLQTRVI